MNLPAWIRETPWLHGPLLRFGLTVPGRTIAARLAEQGWRWSGAGFDLRLRRADREMRLPLGKVLWLLGFDLGHLERRALFSPVGGRQVADLRRATWYRLHGGGRIWLPSALEVEPAVDGYLRRGGPQPGGRVFDAGAYAGEFACVAARLVGPAGRVFAFEPDPANRELLARNLAEHGASNVTVVPAALWTGRGSIDFEADGDVGSHVAPGTASPRRVTVPTLGLAEAAAEHGVPDFVKMDIEGGELEVLEAAGARLREWRARFAIASYHRREGARTAERVEAILRAQGYQVETGHPKHTTTWGWKE